MSRHPPAHLDLIDERRLRRIGDLQRDSPRARIVT
jgi:hypothetical protein